MKAKFSAQLLVVGLPVTWVLGPTCPVTALIRTFGFHWARTNEQTILVVVNRPNCNLTFDRFVHG